MNNVELENLCKALIGTRVIAIENRSLNEYKDYDIEEAQNYESDGKIYRLRKKPTIWDVSTDLIKGKDNYSSFKKNWRGEEIKYE
jgi:hypothetical protein